MSMTVDCSDFEKGLKKLVEKTIPPEVGKGLFKAGNELLRDANTIIPTTPREIGDLQGYARTQGQSGMHEIDQIQGAQAFMGKDEVSVNAGFNCVYAARWHELTPEEDRKINWTTPGSGRKYLESKMVVLKEKYMKIVAKHIENVLKRK